MAVFNIVESPPQPRCHTLSSLIIISYQKQIIDRATGAGFRINPRTRSQCYITCFIAIYYKYKSNVNNKLEELVSPVWGRRRKRAKTGHRKDSIGYTSKIFSDLCMFSLEAGTSYYYYSFPSTFRCHTAMISYLSSAKTAYILFLT